MKRLSFKQPRESYVHEVGFEKLTGTGEDVASAVLERDVVGTVTGVAITAADAAAVAPESLPSADTVLVSLMSGTHNHVYRVKIEAKTTLGRVFNEELIVPVWEFERDH